MQSVSALLFSTPFFSQGSPSTPLFFFPPRPFACNSTHKDGYGVNFIFSLFSFSRLRTADRGCRPKHTYQNNTIFLFYLKNAGSFVLLVWLRFSLVWLIGKIGTSCSGHWIPGFSGSRKTKSTPYF